MIRAGPVGGEMIRAGPVGGSDPCKDVQWDEKGRTMISHIYVSFSSELITSVQFAYLQNGALVLSPKYGASEGHNFLTVRLKQDEYVTGLSGVPVVHYGKAIRSLTFHTNRGKHGPIGCLSDKVSANGSKIEIYPGICDRHEFGGFFGSSNKNRRSSIGINVNPIARSNTVVKRENN